MRTHLQPRLLVALACAVGSLAIPFQAPQDTPEKPLAFEAASIKRNLSLKNVISRRQSPGGFTSQNATFLGVILEIYGVKSYQMGAIPRWLETEKYDLFATAGGKATGVEIRAMMRTLLAERLQLRFHRESAEVDGYALVIAKNGPKFHEHRPRPDDNERNLGELTNPDHFSSRAVPMRNFVYYISVTLQAPVADQTELKSAYEIDLRFTSDDAADTGDLGPGSLPTALEAQLGLRLVKQKVAIEKFVIDRVERPSEN